MLGHSRAPKISRTPGTASLLERTKAGATKEQENATGEEWWSEDGTTWDPGLCDIIRGSHEIPSAQSKPCSVRGYAIDAFASLRKRTAQPNAKAMEPDLSDEILESVLEGPLIA